VFAALQSSDIIDAVPYLPTRVKTRDFLACSTLPAILGIITPSISSGASSFSLVRSSNDPLPRHFRIFETTGFLHSRRRRRRSVFRPSKCCSSTAFLRLRFRTRRRTAFPEHSCAALPVILHPKAAEVALTWLRLLELLPLLGVHFVMLPFSLPHVLLPRSRTTHERPRLNARLRPTSSAARDGTSQRSG
jgi:hypothetical protein